MKLVWKCDFCSHTNKDKIDVEKHESSCVFNPINRHCYSCDNRTSGDYPGDGDQCTIHDYDHFFDVEDRDKKCDDWANKEERKLKLKKIKNKINEN